MSQLKVVASYQFLSIAQVAQAALEAQGISSTLENEEIVNIDWMLGNAVGYVKLLVPATQEAEARRILAEQKIHESRRSSSNSDDDSTERCLSCEAPLPADETTCRVCGWSFTNVERDANEAANVRARSGGQIDEDNESEDDPPNANDIHMLGGTWRKKVLIIAIFSNLIWVIYMLLEIIVVENRGFPD